jgi:nucleoside-diphosphate-sugar epimerase
VPRATCKPFSWSSLIIQQLTLYFCSGGSILTTLQNSQFKSIQDLEISALVRGDVKAKILANNGVNPILFSSLDDSEALTKAASSHDIVINTASGFHPDAAKALILGLGQRKKATGKDVYFLHTTGTSNIGDKPITKTYYEPRILSDKDDLYTYLKTRETGEAYAQRTTDLVAIDNGVEQEVKTYLIMSPTIYGIGTGLFNRTSIQLPTIIRSALKVGHVSVLGPGNGTWDAVHIADLVTLYELLLSKVLSESESTSPIPFAKSGIYFSETGDYTFNELAQGLAAELYHQGALQSTEVKHVSIPELTELYGNANDLYSELGYASNSRSRAELGRELGWKPTRTRADFKKNFREEVETIISEGVKGL